MLRMRYNILFGYFIAVPICISLCQFARLRIWLIYTCLLYARSKYHTTLQHRSNAKCYARKNHHSHAHFFFCSHANKVINDMPWKRESEKLEERNEWNHWHGVLSCTPHSRYLRTTRFRIMCFLSPSFSFGDLNDGNPYTNKFSCERTWATKKCHSYS